MQFGKYKDKPIAWVLLKDPDYFDWMYREKMVDMEEYKFMRVLIKILDMKPFSAVNCKICKGENEVTGLTLYQGRYNGDNWFCDEVECEPYSLGAIEGELSWISEYAEFRMHDHNGRLINKYLKAKGVPSRKTKSALKSYFGY